MSRRLLLVILGILCAGMLGGTAARGTARAQQATQPVLLMSGVQLADSTRYSVTIANLGQLTLGDLQVSVQLPADAVFDHALETPGYTQFQGDQSGTLVWNAVSYAPDDVLDAFSFFLQQPSSGTFDVTASWDGANGGQVQRQFQPALQSATDASAAITLDAATLAQGYIPVGNTGVVIFAASGTIPDGTTVQVSVLPAASDPGADQGDLWWCAVVDVEGLPAGASLMLLAPARELLPPNAQITLLQQDGASWDTLADTAQVTGDGQAIMYLHHGGVVASGTGSPNQPRLPSGLTAFQPGFHRPAPPALTNSGSFIAQLVMVGQMQQGARCGGPQEQPCPGGLLPCDQAFNPSLPLSTPGTNVQAGTRSCDNAAMGETTCKISGLNCGGNSPLNDSAQPFQPAGQGHGTTCTFPSIDQAQPFSCGTF